MKEDLHICTTQMKPKMKFNIYKFNIVLSEENNGL